MSGSVKTSTLAVIVMCPPGLHLDQREFCERPLPGYHLALQGPLSMHQFLYSALDQSGPGHGRKMASLDLASLSWVVKSWVFRRGVALHTVDRGIQIKPVDRTWLADSL
jgi:hypothetical protein